mmetsp:Transcript_93497/g.166353  ORF Transcript_93497/g.166353 Transcript_93497/m.166353 type:complete len:284 (-) Transcript_93497:6-857(-)
MLSWGSSVRVSLAVLLGLVPVVFSDPNATNGPTNTSTTTNTTTGTETTSTTTSTIDYNSTTVTTHTLTSTTWTQTTETATESDTSTWTATNTVTSTTLTPLPGIITGTLRMKVTPGASFFTDPNVEMALPMGVSYLGEVPPSLGFGKVISWRNARRMRRLQTGASSSESVDLQYELTIPADAPAPYTTEYVTSSIAYKSEFELVSSIGQALGERCGQGMYDLDFVEHDGPLLDGLQVTTTLAPPENKTVAEGGGGLSASGAWHACLSRGFGVAIALVVSCAKL